MRPNDLSTMDKHRRKQLARWEAKKAKDDEKFEKKIRQQFDQDARDEIEKFGKTYKPEPTKLLDGILKEGMNLLAELEEFPRFHTGSIRDYMIRMITSDVWNPLLFSMGHGNWIGKYREFYIYKDSVLQEKIDVAKTIQAIREHKDSELRHQHLRNFMRSAGRLNAFRAELAVATHKFRTIQNCRIIKEELMMNVWHPRRVEHILETYGWEVLDNLLGVE